MHALLTIAFAFTLGAAVVGGTPVDSLTEAEVEQALRGQVPVRIEPFARPDGKAAGRGLGGITIDRPAREVWVTLARFDDKAEYMPRLKSVVVLEQTPEPASTRLRVRMVADASVTTARYTMVFHLDEAAQTIRWKLDPSAPDNSIADAEGEYRLYAVSEAKTLLVYKSYVDTGRALPRFIQNYVTRRSLPDLLRAIKRRVESGGQWKR